MSYRCLEKVSSPRGKEVIGKHLSNNRINHKLIKCLGTMGKHGAGNMAQWLRALCVLTEDSGSVS